MPGCRFRLFLLLFTLLAFTPAGVYGHYVEGEEVEVSCSNWPYVFVENSEISGVSYDLTKAVFERAKLDFHFEIYPWARIYHYGLTKSHFMIGCLERAYWREFDFYWVGPVNNTANVYFYKLKSNPAQVNTVFEFVNYRVGVQRNSYYERFLLDNSFTDKNIVPLSSHTQSLLMLDAKRVDFVLMEEAAVKGLSERLGFSDEHFEKALIAYRLESYLALSKKTPEPVYKALKQAYQELSKEGVTQDIINSYFGEE